MEVWGKTFPSKPNTPRVAFKRSGCPFRNPHLDLPCPVLTHAERIFVIDRAGILHSVYRIRGKHPIAGSESV